MSRKLNLIVPTPEEDTAINAAISSDPDTYELSDEEFRELRPLRGRPSLESPKVFTGIRLDSDILAAFKATGKGWQTRINAALRDWLKTHSPVA